METNTTGNLTRMANVGGVFAETVGSLSIVLVNVLAIVLISKCRTVPKSVKLLVTNLCLIDMIGAGWGCVRALLRLFFNDDRARCKVDVLFTTCIFNVSALLVSSIAIDRYVSVFYPLTYVKFVTKARLATLCCIWWAFGISVAILSLLVEQTYSAEYGCELRMSMADIFPWFLLLIRLSCIFVCVFSYSKMFWKIISIGKLYNRGMKRRELRCLAKILMIVTPHLTLHVFFVVVFLFKPVIQIHSALKIQSYLTAAVIFIDPFIFVFRFKECRINLPIYCCHWRKEYREKLIKKRTLLYGTYLERDKSRKSENYVTNHI